MPERVVAQVMNIGDYADVQEIANRTGDDYLRDILRHAEIDQFSARSWTYWLTCLHRLILEIEQDQPR